MIHLRGPSCSQQLNGRSRTQHQRQQQHYRCCPVQRHFKLSVVCRYDLRKSANNVEERRQRQLLPRKSAAERTLTQQQLRDAKATLVHQRAFTLCGASKGQLSHHLCLFLLTEQPCLIHVDSGQLASRIASMADVLGLTQPDAAELLVRNGAVLDVLPLRLKSAAEGLSLALGLSKLEALVMLAADLSLLDTPPLRLKQQLQSLAELLQVQFDVVAVMAAACPHLAKVDPPAVQIRWANLQSLLQLSRAHLQSLLLQEPRLLMPSSQTLNQNHRAICQTLGISPETLNRWVLAAPLLLLVPAVQLQDRVEALVSLFSCEVEELNILDATAAAAAAAAAGDSSSTALTAASCDETIEETVVPNVIATANSSSNNSSSSIGCSSSSDWVSVVSDPQQFTAYLSKDPRVLLVKPQEIQPRLAVVQQELYCSHDTLTWLVLSHPSYLAVEPGSVTAWMCDVRHLTQMSATQATRLALCPQVFLTMSPEEVYTSLTNLGRTLQLQHPSALAVAAHEPLLLQQHPALTASALQQLLQLIPDRRLCHQLLLEVPELLLQGQQLQLQLPAAAALLTLTAAQLAVALVREPSLWWVLVPRHTWPDMQRQQQREQQREQQRQQQQQVAPAATAVASMSALLNSGLRSPAVMQQVAVLQPLLLNLGSEAVQSHVLQLVEVCGACHQWQQQLQGVSPEVLGKCILKIVVWKPRMMFLVETGLASRVSLQEVIYMSRDEFERCFSAEYSHWKAARKARQRWESMPPWQQQQWLWQQQQQWQQPEQSWQQQQRQQPEQQQQQQWQHVGRQQDDTQQHTDNLVTALEAFTAAQATASSSSSGGGGGSGAVSRMRTQLLDAARHPQPTSSGSSSSGNDTPLHNELQPDHQQQQPQQLHSNSTTAAAAATGSAAAAAEGEVFYYNDSGPEPWEAEVSSSGSGSSSSSYDGSADPWEAENNSSSSGGGGAGSSSSSYGSSANDSGSWDSTQQQQLQQESKQQPTLLHLPFMRQADMQLLAVQHSAVELYGSWEGSLVQPAGHRQQQGSASET